MSVSSRPPVASQLGVFCLASIVLVGAVQAAPKELPKQAVVRKAIDGDTVLLRDGRLVRYIGIDTPEVHKRKQGRWVIDAAPFGIEASHLNQQLVEGQSITLEYDVQTHDRHGRLLAYVYVGGEMVNALLLETGYAQLLTVPPNVRYVERFRALAAQAREDKRGLWANE